MARTATRSSGRISATAVSAVRDNFAITNTDPLYTVLYRNNYPWPVLSSSRPRVLTDDSDLRRWSPSKYPAVYGGGVARINKRPSALSANPFRFLVPKKTLVCVRRGIRREVLFARGRAGGRHRRPKWNAYSYWRC